MSSSTPSFKARPENKYTKAKRALRSLAISIAFPFSLTLAIIFLFGSGRHFPNSTSRPFWVLPLWFIHLASLGSSVLGGLAAWLVWADGGLHVHSEGLPMYISHVSLTLTWCPSVLVIGAAWLGFLLCVIDVVTLFSCYVAFKRVNPFAKDLVKPCLAWSAYLSAVSYAFIYL